jgi:membrane-associated phospholipid phosphatase
VASLAIVQYVESQTQGEKSMKVLSNLLTVVMVMSIVLLSACTMVVDPNFQPTSAASQVQPDAGAWQPWVLAAGDELRPAAPPDQTASLAEIDELKEMMAQRDSAAEALVTYWDAGSPAYRWVEIAVAAHQALPPGPPFTRPMSLVTVAMSDAMIAAWDAKYTYNRPDPSAQDSTLTALVDAPAVPSYPSEHAVAAGAASTVLSYLFPDDAAKYAALAEEAAHSRLVAGVNYPSDVEAGLALGRAVGQKVIERAMSDGFDAVWEGTVPSEPGQWTGETVFAPLAGTLKAWVLASNDQFRPEAPPAYDSEQALAELAAVTSFTRTFASNAGAFYWQASSGVKYVWYDFANRLLFENHLDDNAPLSALVYAAMTVAQHDGYIGCFDAKYTYWAMRPNQMDPELVTLFPNPPHPTYPSAHSCGSMAATTALASFFPSDAEALNKAAQEAGQARIWAGIHFPIDVIAGEALGKAVGEMVAEHVEAMTQP